jgi:hypothetical protein
LKFNTRLAAIEFILHVVRKSFSAAELFAPASSYEARPILGKLLQSQAGFFLKLNESKEIKRETANLGKSWT